MASGASGEVVHCPNCKEDVPKTLYCLNCGFPLYKDEQPKETAKAEREVKPESNPVKPSEEDAVIMVDDEEEEAKPEEPKVEVPEVKVEAPVVEEKPTPEPDPAPEPTREPDVVPEQAPEPEAKTPEAASEPAPMPEVSEKIEEPTPVVEAAEEAHPTVETPLIEEPKPTEAPSDPLSTGIEKPQVEAVELVEEFQAPKTLAPDALTKDLLESYAKNVTLRLKLVKLYREGSLKEETFTRLYKGYAMEGKIWASRREEILKRLAVEMEEMEDGHNEATDVLELLEVRRSIGEASAGEYAVKAPAYRWIIDNFDNLIGENRNMTAYLENISNALTDAEHKDLRELASLQYNTLESLQVSNDEFLASLKDDLYEAIKMLG